MTNVSFCRRICAMLICLLSSWIPEASAAPNSTLHFKSPTDVVAISKYTPSTDSVTFEAVFALDVNQSISELRDVYTENWSGQGSAAQRQFSVNSSGLGGFAAPVSNSAGGGLTKASPISLHTWHHAAYVVSKAGLTERLYLDGVLVSTRTSSGSAIWGSTAGYCTLGYGWLGHLSSFRISRVARYTGNTYPVSYSKFISDADTLLLYNFSNIVGNTIPDESGNGRTGTTGGAFYGSGTLSSPVPSEFPLAPTITTQPSSVTVDRGAAVTFSVVATATPPVSYQWRKGGVNIPGVTTATVIFPVAVTSDAGSYDVVVTNAAGSVTSTSATLSFVETPPELSLPKATNPRFSQRTDGSRLVDIYYALDGGTSSVALGVSLDGGTTFTSVKTLTGDVGAAVSSGTAKHIVWNAGADYPNLSAPVAKVRVTPLLNGVGGSFTPIPGGTFQMGNLTGDADITSAGTAAVTLSPCYMAVGPTTKAQWDAIRAWGVSNGYTDLSPGEGKAADHPVQRVSWYDALKWANAASEKEGLTPCYKVGATVVRTGTGDTVSCDWSAGGYRLPTEAEWEVAARGGLRGKRFPWGDTISHSQANYKANPADAYDLSASVNDHHPAHKSGVAPYTNPVASFGANGYGLYDMAGNVWQWCWYKYAVPYAGGMNPRGGAAGGFRVFRGGLWYHNASMARSAGRYADQPGFGNNSLGFRLVRGGSSGSAGWTESVSGAVDTVPPVVSVGGTVSVTATAASGAAVTLSGASATDNIGTPVLTYSPASGSTFPVGTTTVTVTASDSVGNKTSGTFKVTVAQPVANIAGAGGSLALIPGGTYQMGNLSGDSDITTAGTVSVTLSPFYMAVHPTTKTQWDTVRTWATVNGYTDLATGAGKAADHPVQTVRWDDVVKWANAASEKEGLTPCYQVAGSIVRTGTSNAVTCDWTANGYRLPTEAEWEVAARGGLSGKRFPWGDTISHSQANYRASTSYVYDLSGSVNDNHPTYKTGATPYTSPVGSFAANGYGLYDMAGNVRQWCWDWYGTPYAGGTDPRGISTGSFRVLRGGFWYYGASDARSAYRNYYAPSGAYNGYGFRLARGRL